MYYLHGIDRNYDNLKTFLQIPKNTVYGELVNHYNHYISTHSAFEVSVDWKKIRIMDFKKLHGVAPDFCKNQADFFGINSEIISDRIKNQYFELALDKLKDFQPEFYKFVNLMIKLVVINQLVKYTEGTSYETLGLSCMDFREKYNEQDFYELLFHQLVHMLTFVDDRLDDYILPEYKNTFVEADFEHKAGGNNFPFFIGFHSYIVGVEILLYRKNTSTLDFLGNYHGSTHSILDKCIRANKHINHHFDKFTPRGKEILLTAYQRLKEIEKFVKS